MRAWLLAGIVCASQLCARADTNSTFVWGGAPCEISIGEVSDRTARLVVAPLDERGRPLPVLPSAAFVAFPTTEKFRGRNLAGSREIRAGKMRITVKAQPLTISVRRPDGSLVQELVLDDGTNGTVSFHTGAPVFGLGEGEKQFDRRGSLYPMINGQRAPLLATLGTTIPVPFLIGADGWSLFVRGPWGRFDLRGKEGRFLPNPQALGREPLTVYLSQLDEPADALAEYVRLTGHPAMPAKWVMGYMQSHRTLLGPEDA
ncbi:MAG TPA: hypothetical protein VF430_09975, partial [Verrucomicrobiae bacterium]